MDKGDSPPPPPDQAALVQAQAEANRVNTITPFGSLTFTGPNRNTAIVGLSPNQQALASALEDQALTTVGQLATTPFSFEGLPGFVSEIDLSGDLSRENVESAVFERQRGLLDPVFARQERALEQRLANQGIPFGSEAFDDAFQQFNTSRNEAFSNAALDAISAGGAEQSRLFGQALSNANLQNLARGQGIDERLLQRQTPINELSALQTGQQLLPQITGGFPQVDVVGPALAAQNAELAAFNANQAQQQAGLGGLFDLGSAFILGEAFGAF